MHKHPIMSDTHNRGRYMDEFKVNNQFEQKLNKKMNCQNKNAMNLSLN